MSKDKLLRDKMIQELLENCEAILFDKDGTLIDFNPLWLNWAHKVAEDLSGKVSGLEAEEVLEQWGVDCDVDIVDSEGPLAVGSMDDLVGTAAGKVYQHSNSWPESRKIVKHSIARAQNDFDKDEYYQPIEGTSLLIKELKKRGYKLAVVTADSTVGAIECLKSIELFEYFDAVLGYDQVENSKPAPDLALSACELLEILPEKVAVIGDTKADLQMGREAGLAYCIGVTSGLSNEEELSSNADIVLKNAAELLDNKFFIKDGEE